MANSLWFDAVFGRNLAAEIINFARAPFLLVTMKDMRALVAEQFGELDAAGRVLFVDSMEEEDILSSLSNCGEFASVVGFGGGRALDAAKYFAWRRNKPLFQIPTSLSVDAAFGHRAAVRRQRLVRYVGWAVPECVFIDYDIIRAAPPILNHCGIGDVLCFHTAILDWQLAAAQGRCEKQWPYDDSLAAQSLEHAEAVVSFRDDIKNLTDTGIRTLVNGHRWGGGCYHAAGWNPRPVEGTEHFIFYALEHKTGKPFLHGQPVCLGVVAALMMHKHPRTEEIYNVIRGIGVDIRPEAMRIKWDDVSAALTGVRNFVEAGGFWWGIAHEKIIDKKFVDDLRALLESSAP